MPDEILTDAEWKLKTVECLTSMNAQLASYMGKFDEYIIEERKTHQGIDKELKRLNSLAFNFLKWSCLTLLAVVGYLLIFGPPWQIV